MLTQYTSIIAATLLRRRAVALDGKVSALSAADRFSTLSRMCSESRMLCVDLGSILHTDES